MSPNRPTRYYAFGFVESNVIIGGVDWTVFSRYRTGVVSYIPYFLKDAVPILDTKLSSYSKSSSSLPTDTWNSFIASPSKIGSD